MVGILADPDHPERDDHLERLGLDSADEFDPVAMWLRAHARPISAAPRPSAGRAD